MSLPLSRTDLLSRLMQGPRPSGATSPAPAIAVGRGIGSGLQKRSFVRYHEAPQGDAIMCRNIKTLHNFMPPATDDEVHVNGGMPDLSR